MLLHVACSYICAIGGILQVEWGERGLMDGMKPVVFVDETLFGGFGYIGGAVFLIPAVAIPLVEQKFSTGGYIVLFVFFLVGAILAFGRESPCFTGKS